MKSHFKIILVSFFRSLFILFLVLNLSQCKNPGFKSIADCKLQNGDIVFRRGRSVESHTVILTDRKSTYSHVGIICFDNELPFVIHAVPGENKKGPDFIKKEKLSEFLSPKKATHFAIYRSDFSLEVKNYAAINAMQFFTNKLTFDNTYDLNSDKQLYCTELVLKAFQIASQTKLEIESTNLTFIFGTVEIVMPGNIIENPHFNQIFIH